MILFVGCLPAELSPMDKPILVSHARAWYFLLSKHIQRPPLAAISKPKRTIAIPFVLELIAKDGYIVGH